MTAVDWAREERCNDIAEFISSYKPLPRGELILNEINSLSVVHKVGVYLRDRLCMTTARSEGGLSLMFFPSVDVMIMSYL